MTPVVSIREATFLAGGKRAVDRVSLDVAPGSTVAILGPSGSGKTSLMRLCAGLEVLDGGSIYLAGRLASEAGLHRVPVEERGLAMAFQYPALLPHLTVLQNTTLGLQGPKADLADRGRRCLQDVGLAGFESRRVWQLSGGEAQRVALARALARRCRLLLLDEPFANVDRLNRRDLIVRLGDRLREGGGPDCAVLLVSHDPADALDLADRTVLMKDGRIAADGAFGDIAAGSCGEWAATFLSVARQP